MLGLRYLRRGETVFGGKKKEAKQLKAGPYRVDGIATDTALQALLNRRYGEGYDVVQILPNLLSGTNNGRSVVFKKRDTQPQ